MVLTFESVDKILWCDHSNETSSVVLSMVLFLFTYLSKCNLGFVLNFDLKHSGVKGLRLSQSKREIFLTFN